MQRRQFLRTTVLAVGGVGLVGCGKGSDASPAPKPPFGGRTIRAGAEYFPQSIASGDPRADSVILWTRAARDSQPGDLTLMLEVALDEQFSMPVELGEPVMLAAEQSHDGCVRVRVKGLEASTHYYYRFAYIDGEYAFVSRTGRTKTAPLATDDVPVHFAVASCQDYGGRYYHAYKHMAEQDLDFFVHLGDYIYETTGDPSFQAVGGKRIVEFDDPKNAIELGEADQAYYAAKSLEQYRTLYKTLRSDPDLQRVHELFPMVAVWDDHEYSDDCHGQTATYLNGAADERDALRRANADEAWFDFMPVDYATQDFVYDRTAAEFPADLTIYRDFAFGKHLHLVMTDLRRYRGDHLVPEDAFPGAVAVTEDELLHALGSIPAFAVAYVDLDVAEFAIHKPALNQSASMLGFVEGDFQGLIDVAFVNAQLAKLSGEKPAAIDATGRKRGISFTSMFKTGRFSEVGSRYVALREPFDAYAHSLWLKQGDKAQQVFGAKQERWFIDTIRASKQTWKVWGNEYTLMRRTVDLRAQPAAAALGLQALLNLSVEDWEGVPDRRSKILESLSEVDNVVAVTGDIHAFFAGFSLSDQNPAKGILEFVAGAISSATYQDLITATALALSPLAAALAENAKALLTAANPHLAHLDLTRNGYGVFTADAQTLTATYYAIDGAAVLKPTLAGTLEQAFTSTAFRVEAGKQVLLRDQNGKTERWDVKTGAWVADA